MINTRQVNVKRDDASSNYTTLYDYLKRKKVVRIPFLEAQKVTIGSVQHIIISTTHLSGMILAVLDADPPTSIANGGVCAAELVGAIDVAAVTHHKDNLGNILNLVTIRDATTHDELVTPDGRTIFALIQSTNGVADGSAVGAPASENTQLSFVYIADDSTVTLITAGWIATDVEFHTNKLYMELRIPLIYMEGGQLDPLVIEPAIMEPDVRKFVVTTAFADGEVITLSSGGGTGSGLSTPTGDTVVVDATAALFNANNLNRIRLNGVQLIRGVEVEWESTLTISINLIMDIGDVLEVEVPNL